MPGVAILMLLGALIAAFMAGRAFGRDAGEVNALRWRGDADRWHSFLDRAYLVVTEDGDVALGTTFDEQEAYRESFPKTMKTLDDDVVRNEFEITQFFDHVSPSTRSVARIAS